MYKILLTGATGFIGSFLLKNLSTKNHFVVITRSNSRKFNSFKNIKIIKYKNFNELNSKLKKVKIDIVIHCATHYVKKHNFDDIEKLTKSNILFGNVILENIKQMRVKNLLISPQYGPIITVKLKIHIIYMRHTKVLLVIF